MVNKVFKIRRKHVDRAALGVFRVVVVPAPVGGSDLDDIKGLLAHHRAGQFAPGDEALDEYDFAVIPITSREFLRRMFMIFVDDEHADGRAFADRLYGRREAASGGPWPPPACAS